MSGVFNAKVLGDGTLPAGQTPIYTVPAATVAYVKQLFLLNENAIAQSIQLWINTSGTARKWRNLQLMVGWSADLLEEGESLQLQAGDTIMAQTTTAGAVPYTITGVEET